MYLICPLFLTENRIRQEGNDVMCNISTKDPPSELIASTVHTPSLGTRDHHKIIMRSYLWWLISVLQVFISKFVQNQ